MREILSGITLSDWFTSISTLFGVVIGGIISAIISYWTARQAANEARKLAADTRIGLDKHSAFRLMSKLMKIANDTDFLIRHFDSAMDLNDNRNSMTGLWTYIVPVVGLENRHSSVEPDELALFLSIKEYDYAQELLHLFEEFSSMIDGFNAYCERREQLTIQISALEGGVSEIAAERITSDIKSTDLKQFEPIMITLDQLVVNLIEKSTKQMQNVHKVIEKFSPLMKVYFSDAEFPSLELATSLKATQ